MIMVGLGKQRWSLVRLRDDGGGTNEYGRRLENWWRGLEVVCDISEIDCEEFGV